MVWFYKIFFLTHASLFNIHKRQVWSFIQLGSCKLLPEFLEFRQLPKLSTFWRNFVSFIFIIMTKLPELHLLLEKAPALENDFPFFHHHFLQAHIEEDLSCILFMNEYRYNILIFDSNILIFWYKIWLNLPTIWMKETKYLYENKNHYS